MALFRPNNLLKLVRGQSLPAVFYHKNVSNINNRIDPTTFMKTNSLYLQVLDHYENPRNVGSFDKKDKSIGTGLVGAPACGDVMKLQIKVDETGKIVDAKFKTFGCGSAIASSSLATEWVKGKTVDEAGKLKNSDIAKELCLPPVKLHCSSEFIEMTVSDYDEIWIYIQSFITVLAEDAIKAALADYKIKQQSNEN